MIENETKKVLNQIGVGIHLKGYKLIVAMILELFIDENIKITELYKKIAEENNMTYSRVERNIRHSMLFCKDNIGRCFGVNYKITNSSFIKLIFEEVKRNLEG